MESATITPLTAAAAHEHVDFVSQQLPIELKTMLETALAASSSPSASLALEIAVRKHAASIVTSASTCSDSKKKKQKQLVQDLGLFWSNVLQLACHVTLFGAVAATEKDTNDNDGDDDDDNQKKPEPQNKEFAPLLADSGNVCKVHIPLLEDITDILTARAAQTFWMKYVVPQYAILFGETLWKTNGKSNPCGLPMLKVAQKLQRRFVDNHVAKGEILCLLAKVFPLLSERSANQAYGSHNDDQTVLDSLEEYNNEDDETNSEETSLLQQREAIATSTTTATTNTNNYNVYQNFWKLQQDLANPNAIQVADFLQRAKTVLSALESGSQTKTTTSSDDNNDSTGKLLVVANHNNNNDDKTTTSKSNNTSLRYLTSARILPIQVESMDFATQIITQLLIVIHHVQLNVPRLKTQLTPLVQRARKIILSSTEGRQMQQRLHLKNLDAALASEVSWRTWKQQKCPASMFDQVKSSAAAPPSVASTTKRRRLSEQSQAAAVKSGVNKLESLSNVRKNLAKYSSELGKSAPKAHDFLDPYVQALDPEAGIEAEYHPGNNAPFGWRALRLLCTHNLSDFKLIHASGNYETLVRSIYSREGKSIPGPIPEVPGDEDMVPAVEEEEEEESAVEDGDAKKNATDDEDETMEEAKGQDDNLEIDKEAEDTATETMKVDQEDPAVVDPKNDQAEEETKEKVKEPQAKSDTGREKDQKTKQEPPPPRKLNSSEQREATKKFTPPQRGGASSSTLVGKKRSRSPIASPPVRSNIRGANQPPPPLRGGGGSRNRDSRPRDRPPPRNNDGPPPQQRADLGGSSNNGPPGRGGDRMNDGPRDRSNGPPARDRNNNNDGPRDRSDGPLPPPSRDGPTPRDRDGYPRGGGDRRDGGPPPPQRMGDNRDRSRGSSGRQGGGGGRDRRDGGGGSGHGRGRR